MHEVEVTEEVAHSHHAALHTYRFVIRGGGDTSKGAIVGAPLVPSEVTALPTAADKPLLKRLDSRTERAREASTELRVGGLWVND